MSPVEFETKIENGSIRVPDEYKDRFKDPVRVILLADEETPGSDLIDRLLASPLKIAGFAPLSRQEIYERQ